MIIGLALSALGSMLRNVPNVVPALLCPHDGAAASASDTIVTSRLRARVPLVFI